MRDDRAFDLFNHVWQRKASSVVFIPRNHKGRIRTKPKVRILRSKKSKPEARYYDEERDERRSRSRSREELMREPRRSRSPTRRRSSRSPARYSPSFDDDDIGYDTVPAITRTRSNSRRRISSSSFDEEDRTNPLFSPIRCLEDNGLTDKGEPTIFAQAAIALGLCFGLAMLVG